MATKKQAEARALEERFEAILDGHGTTARLARALNMSPSTLHRIWAGQSKRPPGYLVALVEFLETTPEEEWPERWRT
jgi:lambda repressor-like predicted transcriptional regulator